MSAPYWCGFKYTKEAKKVLGDAYKEMKKGLTEINKYLKRGNKVKIPPKVIPMDLYEFSAALMFYELLKRIPAIWRVQNPERRKLIIQGIYDEVSKKLPVPIRELKKVYPSVRILLKLFKTQGPPVEYFTSKPATVMEAPPPEMKMKVSKPKKKDLPPEIVEPLPEIDEGSPEFTTEEIFHEPTEEEAYYQLQEEGPEELPEFTAEEIAEMGSGLRRRRRMRRPSMAKFICKCKGGDLLQAGCESCGGRRRLRRPIYRNSLGQFCVPRRGGDLIEYGDDAMGGARRRSVYRNSLGQYCAPRRRY